MQVGRSSRSEKYRQFSNLKGVLVYSKEMFHKCSQGVPSIFCSQYSLPGQLPTFCLHIHEDASTQFCPGVFFPVRSFPGPRSETSNLSAKYKNIPSRNSQRLSRAVLFFLQGLLLSLTFSVETRRGAVLACSCDGPQARAAGEGVGSVSAGIRDHEPALSCETGPGHVQDHRRVR